MSHFEVPLGVLTDSYKASHFLMYPDANRMSAYGEFRAPMELNKEDHRFIFYGIRYIMENWVNKKNGLLKKFKKQTYFIKPIMQDILHFLFLKNYLKNL